MADSVLVQFAQQAEAQAEEEVVSAIMILIYGTRECQLAIPVGLTPDEVLAYCNCAVLRAQRRIEEVKSFN